MKLIDAIKEAEAGKVAIGHFNISTLEIFWGIINAVKELSEAEGRKLPVVVGTSEGEADGMGRRQVVELVKSVREEFGLPVFLNGDHNHSLEGFKLAVDAGYDMAIIDGAKLPFDENVKMTKEAVEYARSVNPEMLVEGELGYIGTSSKMLDDVPEGAEISKDKLTTPEQAEEFRKKTGIDLFAPAVGNLHGMLKNASNPALDIERISLIREAADVPLVLHGGSGVSDDDFKKAAEAGMSMIHVSTEIRVAYRKALEGSLNASPDELAPYRYLAPAVKSVENVVKDRVSLFSGLQ